MTKKIMIFIFFFIPFIFYAENNFLLNYIKNNKINTDFIKTAGLKNKNEIKFDKDGKMLPPNKIAEKIIKNAKSLLNTKNYRFIKNANFNWDCSGTVLAAHYISGLDLRKNYLKHPGNGVKRLYEISKKDLKTIYKSKFPLPGDVIFWSNTYDKNRNKKWDDPLTHTGIVISVDKNGTIKYLHLDYTRGVVVAYMNLFHPNDKNLKINGKTLTINSGMRMRKDVYLNPKKRLSSQLFEAFGRLYK